MIGAMVDLYCLAKCSKIYGSHGSSFSDVAARIGNIPLKVMKKVWGQYEWVGLVIFNKSGSGIGKNIQGF